DKVKVMVGGAAVNEDFVREIGADGYAENANDAVIKAKDMLK
ncbi:MAG: cobalamin-binding protein, partial [Candidatus Bathyarchaeia archaeon]